MVTKIVFENFDTDEMFCSNFAFALVLTLDFCSLQL